MKQGNGIYLGLVLTALSGSMAAQVITPAAGPRAEKGARSAGEGEQEWMHLESPALGYWVRGKQVRMMLGVPGAAHLSEAIAPPRAVARVEAAPGHGWVLALTKAEALAWRPETGESWPLAAVVGLADLTAISPTGGEAAFWFADEARLVVYEGLPAEPRVRAEVSGLTWPAGLRALALAPGGARLAGVAADGLYLLRPEAEAAPELLDAQAGLAGPVFAAAGDRLLYLAMEQAEVRLAEQDAGVFHTRRLAGTADGLVAPERAAFGPREAVWVASREAEALWKVDGAGGGVERYAAPAGAVERLRNREVLLLSGADEAASLILMPGGGTTEFSWVPAPAGEMAVALGGEVRQ